MNSLKNQKICLREFIPNYTLNENNYTDIRIKLNPDFKGDIFTRLLKSHGWERLEKELKISRSMLYHYKNNRINNISLKQLLRCISLLNLDIEEVKDKIEGIFSRREQIGKCLVLGANKRHNQLRVYKKEIPKLEELVNNNMINFEKWFDKYIKLINFGSRQIISINRTKNKIILRYSSYSLSKRKIFENAFPRKIKIDEEFEYFFGLWCGDRVGKGRFGVVNKEKAINLVTKKYLLNLYQKSVSILHVNEGIKVPDLDYVDGIYINHAKTKIKGYSISVYSKNAILFTFFDYLRKHLNQLMELLPHKNIFFTGLFDAEGNVFLEDGCFRWACKNVYLTNIYIKYLKKMNLFKRYDGSNLVCNNSNDFSILILPYLKHPKKINDARLICFGKGKLNNKFISVLNAIRENNGYQMTKIAKALKKVKVYAQIRFLQRLNYVQCQGYPKKVFITEKGMAALSHGGKDK